MFAGGQRGREQETRLVSTDARYCELLKMCECVSVESLNVSNHPLLSLKVEGRDISFPLVAYYHGAVSGMYCVLNMVCTGT